MASNVAQIAYLLFILIFHSAKRATIVLVVYIFPLSELMVRQTPLLGGVSLTLFIRDKRIEQHN